jgi:hypothetical protein
MKFTQYEPTSVYNCIGNRVLHTIHDKTRLNIQSGQRNILSLKDEKTPTTYKVNLGAYARLAR